MFFILRMHLTTIQYLHKDEKKCSRFVCDSLFFNFLNKNRHQYYFLTYALPIRDQNVDVICNFYSLVSFNFYSTSIHLSALAVILSLTNFFFFLCSQGRIVPFLLHSFPISILYIQKIIS